MYYEPGIGSYTNDLFEKILDTEFYYNIPYLFDREKYTSVVKKYGLTTDIKTANVVSFTTDYDTDEENGKIGSRSFFVWPENNHEDSESIDWHDVFFFGGFNELNLDDYETVVKDILGCVTKVDVECTEEKLRKRIGVMDKILGEIGVLRKILNDNE